VKKGEDGRYREREEETEKAREKEGGGGGGGKESKSHKVKSLRLIELEVTDRVPSAPGATNLMQLLYNSLCRLALTTDRTISEIELLSSPLPRKFPGPSPLVTIVTGNAILVGMFEKTFEKLFSCNFVYLTA